MPANARVIAPLPDNLDEYAEEGGGKYLPGQATTSTVEAVTVYFINQVTVSFYFCLDLVHFWRDCTVC